MSISTSLVNTDMVCPYCGGKLSFIKAMWIDDELSTGCNKCGRVESGVPRYIFRWVAEEIAGDNCNERRGETALLIYSFLRSDVWKREKGGSE